MNPFQYLQAPLDSLFMMVTVASKQKLARKNALRVNIYMRDRGVFSIQRIQGPAVHGRPSEIDLLTFISD